MGYLLPTCSIFFSVLLCIIYFSKKRIKILENRAYSFMVVFVLITSIIESFLQFITLNGTNATTDMFAYVLNRITFILVLNYFFCLFIYIMLISNSKTAYYLKKYMIHIIAAKILFVILILLLKINIIENDGYYSITGSAVQLTYAMCLLYYIISLIIGLLNVRKNDKRYIPVFAILFIMVFVLISFQLNPYLIIVSISFTFLNYIMYFTIENPDVLMIEQLNIAKDQADKANRAKSDFLSSMSHEIRTPLNAIVGFSEDIQTNIDNANPQIVEDAGYIMEASKTLLEIVGNILDISKIESNKMEITEEKYNFKKEVETLARIDATRIGDKKIDFKIDLAEDIPYELMGDKTHVKQILNNLLSNAFKYTDEGEVTLSVKCINQGNICHLMISVKDTGKGIKPEDINRLFSKFERLETTRNSTIEGTGLGLAITKKLVDLMGGKINVQSSYGQGSLFVVQLPQKIATYSAPAEEIVIHKAEDNDNVETLEAATTTNVSTDRKKLLIVDDNKLNIKVARRALEELNFYIDECYNGLECLEKVKLGNEYDVILMDIMMPEMSGESAFAKLKENPNFNIPTIALTADAVAGVEDKYKEEGFVDYIAKPFTRDEIKEKLDLIFKK